MAKLTSRNPANGDELGTVTLSTKADVLLAVTAARKAFPDWANTPLPKRILVISKLAGLLKKTQDKLAKLITLEMGKPLVEAKDEIATFSLPFLKDLAKNAPRWLADEVLHTAKNGKEVSLIRHTPIGVVGVIKPWNFPVDTALWAIAPALLTGNTVVFKPSESVPLTSKLLAELIWQAGVPKDVFQILYGRAQVGEMLTDSHLNMIAFTGSNAVGSLIAAKCAAKMIKCVLEMGGSSPALVARDADLDFAAKAIVYGRFSNNGQACDSIKRVFVESRVASKLSNRIVKLVKALRVGNPLEKGVDLGPLVNQKQLETFEVQVTQGVVQGGRIIAGGRRLREGDYAKGWFHEPTVMIHVHSKMNIMQEEVFGPLLPICEVENFNAAVRQANQSHFGLTAAVFTKSLTTWQQAEKGLQAGSVFLNESVYMTPSSPWSTVKQSGLGVERGKYGLWEYTVKKHVYLNRAGTKDRSNWFPY